MADHNVDEVTMARRLPDGTPDVSAGAVHLITDEQTGAVVERRPVAEVAIEDAPGGVHQAGAIFGTNRNLSAEEASRLPEPGAIEGVNDAAARQAAADDSVRDAEAEGQAPAHGSDTAASVQKGEAREGVAVGADGQGRE